MLGVLKVTQHNPAKHLEVRPRAGLHVRRQTSTGLSRSRRSTSSCTPSTGSTPRRSPSSRPRSSRWSDRWRGAPEVDGEPDSPARRPSPHALQGWLGVRAHLVLLTVPSSPATAPERRPVADTDMRLAGHVSITVPRASAQHDMQERRVPDLASGKASRRSGRLDLNQRPPAPKAGALPGCATSRGLQSTSAAGRLGVGGDRDPAAPDLDQAARAKIAQHAAYGDP